MSTHNIWFCTEIRKNQYFCLIDALSSSRAKKYTFYISVYTCLVLFSITRLVLIKE